MNDMSARIITFILLISSYLALAEPAGFEIINKSNKAEKITISNGVSLFTITLKSEENFVYRTTSSMSQPIVLKCSIDGYPDEKNIFQWATFTIDMSGRYLSTFSNQASKIFPLEDITSKAIFSLISNEYIVTITSLTKK